MVLQYLENKQEIPTAGWYVLQWTFLSHNPAGSLLADTDTAPEQIYYNAAQKCDMDGMGLKR